MTGSIINANGIEVAYDEFGDRADPSIVLIMGLGTQMIAWPEDFCRGLAARGFHVVRFDNRDIGLSTKFDDRRHPGIFMLILASTIGLPIRVPYTLKDMAGDAVGVLDALNIEAAHVVGASMGGMIAQLVAALHPERCLTLTSIMSSSGRRGLPRAKTHVTRHMLTRPASNQAEARVHHAMRTYELIGSPGYPPEPEQLKQKILASYQRSDYAEGFMRQFSAIAASGSRVRYLRRIAAPTLVLHGRDDPLVPVAHGIDTARWIRDARLEIIDGWGHDLPITLVPRFVQLIGDHALGAPGFAKTG